jgi:hypothetical protein
MAIAESENSTKTDEPQPLEFTKQGYEAHPESNRSVWVVMFVILVVLIAGYFVAKKSPPSAVVPGERAVVIPTDVTRTVIVVPCGTGAAVATTDAAKALNTIGSVAVTFPAGHGNRVVMVPKCNGGHAGVAGQTNLPSAAFVYQAGTPLPVIGGARSVSSKGFSSSESSSAANRFSAELEVTLPAGSSARNIVVGPCERSRYNGPAESILQPSQNQTTAIAPSC